MRLLGGRLERERITRRGPAGGRVDARRHRDDADVADDRLGETPGRQDGVVALVYDLVRHEHIDPVSRHDIARDAAHVAHSHADPALAGGEHHA